ncbi:sugar porter family MFS transporter [bacterium]|nr:sugar porter family MFS transporter [bacterium]
MTVVIAAAEVIGEVTVMGLADRIGKRRLSLIGSAVSALSYVILPHLDTSLPLALAGVFVMFLFVEIGIVAAIPLFSEVLPEARAVMMSGVIGASSLGRFLGAAGGGALLALVGDFAVIGLVSTGVGLLAVFSMWRFVPEGGR